MSPEQISVLLNLSHSALIMNLIKLKDTAKLEPVISMSPEQISVLLSLTHSALIMNLIKLKGTAKLTAQDEQVCLKDSKYIFV